MEIHIGEKVKARAKELRIGPTELGKMINTSKQNIYGIFKRKSIDTELLKKISKALDFDFFQLYIDREKFWTEPVEGGYKKGSTSTPLKSYKELLSELSDCRKDFLDLQEKYELTKKLNVMLEARLKEK